MAVSSYDFFAVNDKGEPVRNIFSVANDIKVNIRKTWINVEDPKAWDESYTLFVKPVVLQISEGEVFYKSLQIKAISGFEEDPSNSIYFVIWDKQSKTGITGVACYGYCGDEWVGVTKNHIKHLKEEFLNKTVRVRSDVRHYGMSHINDIKDLSEGDPNDKVFPNAKFIDDYIIEYDEYVYDIPDVFRELDLSRGLRVSQGDLYFEEHLGLEPYATEVKD